MSLLSGATLTMAHPDRTRLQVFIPTATAEALGIAAESLGLSKTQTVEMILGQYLTRQGMLTTNTAAWPKPKPPASVQRPITLPTHLVKWLQSQPGNISDATRSAIASGFALNSRAASRTVRRKNGCNIEAGSTYESRRRWRTSSKSAKHKKISVGAKWHSPTSSAPTSRPTTPPKAPRSPRGHIPHWDGPNSGTRRPLYETQPF